MEVGGGEQGLARSGVLRVRRANRKYCDRRQRVVGCWHQLVAHTPRRSPSAPGGTRGSRARAAGRVSPAGRSMARAGDGLKKRGGGGGGGGQPEAAATHAKPKPGHAGGGGGHLGTRRAQAAACGTHSLCIRIRSAVACAGGPRESARAPLTPPFSPGARGAALLGLVAVAAAAATAAVVYSGLLASSPGTREAANAWRWGTFRPGAPHPAAAGRPRHGQRVAPSPDARARRAGAGMHCHGMHCRHVLWAAHARAHGGGGVGGTAMARRLA